MDMLFNSLSTMMVLLITVAVGYMTRKIGMVDDHFDNTMSAVIMKIA